MRPTSEIERILESRLGLIADNLQTVNSINLDPKNVNELLKALFAMIANQASRIDAIQALDCDAFPFELLELEGQSFLQVTTLLLSELKKLKANGID